MQENSEMGKKTTRSTKDKTTPSFTIKDLIKKGKGLVASRKISAGELIICEKPCLVLQLKDINNDKVTKAFNHLPKEKQTKFLELTTSKETPADEPKKSDIFLNNAINVNDDVFGVFLDVSRVNHSCDPNAAWGTTQQEDTLELRAIRDIMEDEEICVDYIGDKSFLMTTADRKR